MFDASAVLAMVLAEDGALVAASALAAHGGVISTVNAGEAIGKLVRRGSTLAKAMHMVEALELTWQPPDSGQAARAGELATINDLSLADRFCIALGEARGEPIVTADHDWIGLDLKVPLELIR